MIANDLTDKAISEALKSNWTQAIEINKEIIKNDPSDIEALNRLAKAYFESGNLARAKKTSLAILKIDPLNNIAQKAISKYKSMKNKNVKNHDHTNIDFSDFIEEVGTTKQTALLNLCSENLISSLGSGDELDLISHAHKVSVVTSDKIYIGKLPDDLAAIIRESSKKGYQYKVIVKSAEKQCVKVIIKELKRAKGFEGKPTFSRDFSESFGEGSS